MAQRLDPLSHSLLNSSLTYQSTNMYEPVHHKDSVVSMASSVNSSGSVSSVSSVQPTVRIIDTVMALYSYNSDKPHSLSFKRGDTIYVVTKLGSGWWEGVLASGQQGWFPSNYTQTLPVAQPPPPQLQQQQFLHPPNSQSVYSFASSGRDGSIVTAPGKSESIDPLESTTATASTTTTVVHNGANTPLFLQTGGAMGFDVDEDSSTSSVLANSRKGSVVSYGSSTNDVDHDLPPHSEYLEGYKAVDSKDPAYNYPPTYWIPQISNTGKLLYVNTARKHVTHDLPFEKIDPNFSEQEEKISTYIPAPPEIADNTRIVMVDDRKILDDSLNAFAIRKSKSESSDSGSRRHVLEHNFDPGLGIGIEIPECKTWSEVISMVKQDAVATVKSFNSRDPSLDRKFEILSYSIHRLSSYAGVPPGTYPSLAEFSEIGLVYRKMVNTLAKMGLYKDIMVEQRAPGIKGQSDVFSDLTNDLVALSVKFIQLYKSFINSELQFLSDVKHGEDDILRRPSIFQVRHFVDGAWTTVSMNAMGQVVVLEIETPAYNIGTTMRPRVEREVELPLLPLESYSTSLELDNEVLESLEGRNKNLKNILAQVFGSGSPVLPWTVEGTRDRRKLLSSSLHTFSNVVRLMLNILESIDLSVFYDGGNEPGTPKSNHHLLSILFTYLGTKQTLYESINDLNAAIKQNDSTDSDLIAALTAKFEQTQIEEFYFSFEQSNEKQIQEKAENLQTEIETAIGLIRALASSKERTPKSSHSSIASVYPHIVASRRSLYDARDVSSVRSLSTTGSDRRKMATISSIPDNTATSASHDGHTPWYLGLEYGKELIYDKRGQPRGGTIRALVEQLTLHNRLNAEFNTAMLLTFRSFTDATVLFDLLLERFLIQPPEGLTQEEFKVWLDKKQRPIRLRVVNIVKTWLDAYWFEDDGEELTPEARTELFNSLTKFCNMLQSQTFPGANSLAALVEKRKHNIEPSFKRYARKIDNDPPAPFVPKNLKKIKLSDIEPLEMARQLCLREFRLFMVITSHECLRRACSGRSKSGNPGGQRIGDFIKNSNNLTNWVSYSILKHAEPRRRAGLIRYFILVAEECRKLYNFSSMTAIISALYSSTIHRMKKTWDYVTRNNVQRLETMNRLMNSSRNFNEYRDQLGVVSGRPVVPFFGVYLTDLTFVEGGNPDYLQAEQGIINFAKRMKAADIIESIRQFQTTPYNFVDIPEIQRFLDEGFQNAPPIEEQYDTSLNFEPREKPGTDKVAKALEENGLL